MPACHLPQFFCIFQRPMPAVPVKTAPNLQYERMMGLEEGKVICGVDEVGRGPLAGPVVAAAVVLPRGGLPQTIGDRIRDSKSMTPRQREALFPALVELCRYAVAEASVAEIDSLNILRASLLAMQRAVEGLGMKPDTVLIDGKHAPELPCPALTIVKGDGKSLSIAAASIIAKVTRDRLMKRLAAWHPGYGWEQNAGYGTARHIAALRALGPTEWHRKSFSPVLAARKNMPEGRSGGTAA